MEDRLAGPCTGVDDDTVIAQTLACSYIGDEVEHPLVLVGGELADLAKGRNVALGDDEQVNGRLGIDVTDGDEPLR